eukprot:5201193-Heterocapsa_arctica.AAC.1
MADGASGELKARGLIILERETQRRLPGREEVVRGLHEANVLGEERGGSSEAGSPCTHEPRCVVGMAGEVSETLAEDASLEGLVDDHAA